MRFPDNVRTVNRPTPGQSRQVQWVCRVAWISDVGDRLEPFAGIGFVGYRESMSESDQQPSPDAASAAARRVISLIDLTDLADDHRADGIDRLLEQALEHQTAAVCVWPEFVGQAAAHLGWSDVRVATVADFPGGRGQLPDVVAEVRRSLVAGADEIDLVLNYRELLAGRPERVGEPIETVAEIVHAAGAHLKVILETGELGDRQTIVDAARIAVASGADFIKTSTGKTSNGASLDAVDAMLDVIAETDRVIGLKPSGGISTVVDALEYIDLVESRLGVERTRADVLRFGASSLLADALRILESTDD